MEKLPETESEHNGVTLNPITAVTFCCALMLMTRKRSNSNSIPCHFLAAILSPLLSGRRTAPAIGSAKCKSDGKWVQPDRHPELWRVVRASIVATFSVYI